MPLFHYLTLNNVQIFPQSSKENGWPEKSTAQYIAQKIIERMDFILDTHSTEHTWRTFYMLNAFSYICTVMIMKLCNMQTNEYDLQVITYPSFGIGHRLHSSNENNNPAFPGSTWSDWQNMMEQPPQTYNHAKYDNNRKGLILPIW